MMLSISTSKFLVAETSSGDYNFHRWTYKLSDDYSLNQCHLVSNQDMLDLLLDRALVMLLLP